MLRKMSVERLGDSTFPPVRLDTEPTRRMTQRLLLGSPTSGGPAAVRWPLTVLLPVDPVG